MERVSKEGRALANFAVIVELFIFKIIIIIIIITIIITVIIIIIKWKKEKKCKHIFEA